MQLRPAKRSGILSVIQVPKYGIVVRVSPVWFANTTGTPRSFAT